MLRFFWQTALAFLPGAKPTACTHRQPHQGLSLTSLKLTAGPLLRGIQAVLQELAGSATGGRGLGAGLVRLEGALRAWLPTHRPAASKGLAPVKPARLARLVGPFLGSFLLSFLFFFLEFFLESGYVIGCFLGNLFLVVVHLAAVCYAQN